MCSWASLPSRKWTTTTSATSTRRPVEVATVVIVRFRDGKLAHEHIYWDQASVLAQLGLINPNGLPVAGAESARKVLDPRLPANALIRRSQRISP